MQCETDSAHFPARNHPATLWLGVNNIGIDALPADSNVGVDSNKLCLIHKTDGNESIYFTG